MASEESSSSSQDSLLDDVFEILNVATQLQKSGGNRIEAATKFYEAVYLMRRYVERLPLTKEGEPNRKLLQDKIIHYEQLASTLMADESSTLNAQQQQHTAHQNNPRSPMSEKAGFLNHQYGGRSESATSSIDLEDIPLVAAELVTPSVAAGLDVAEVAGIEEEYTAAHPAAAAVVAASAAISSNQDEGVAAATTATATRDNINADQQQQQQQRPRGVARNEGDDVPLQHHSLKPRNYEQIRQVQIKANLANAKLAQALDLDEAAATTVTGNSNNNNNNNKKSPQVENAISMYMSAAELYLQALQAANTKIPNSKLTAMAEAIKKRLESTLDRVEKLKTGKTVVDESRQGEQQQQQPRASQQSLRQLPRSLTPPPPPHATLTKEEVAILKRSSLIASGLFLPWCDADAAQLSREVLQQKSSSSAPIAALYTDPSGFLPLSSKQKPHFHKWARPSDICRIRKHYGISRRLQKPVMVHSNITPYSIKQQYVTDCSFIASLCICASFERKFRKQLITSIVYPQTRSDSQLLVYNPAGKYMVKLWLNGVARCVVVDDHLPIDQYGNLLCSHTTSASHPSHFELWVCIIEKAYMKLCGGYDFPGSNSGVDLFSLTGWIPERFHFAKRPDKVRDFETPPERAWERIASASTFGDCLITVSSHVDMSQEDADKLGLVMGHAYAVLSVLETRNGTRLLQLKNPWAHKGWKGRYSRTDAASWRDASFRAEVGYDPDKACEKKDDGVFFICWDDILGYFQNFHLSWNPALFGYRATVHGHWPKGQGPSDDTFNVSENPQYVMSLSDAAINKKATIWILISRHVCKHEQAGREVSDYLTVHLHRSKTANDLVYYPGRSGNCVLTGAYTNNPHVLVRYDVEGPADKFLSLVLSQYKKSNDLSYTLSCYSTEPFDLGKPKSSLPFTKGLSSALTLNGGPLGSKNVVYNPMFALGIPKEDNVVVQFKVSTAKSVALNIIVLPVESYGQHMDRATGHAVIDSGKYRHGFVMTDRKKLKSGGAYVVVISSYTPGQVATFQVHVSSTAQNVRFDPIVPIR